MQAWVHNHCSKALGRALEGAGYIWYPGYHAGVALEWPAGGLAVGPEARHADTVEPVEESAGVLPAEIASGIALAPAGAYMAVRVFLPRHFLRVRARQGERKLVFRGKVDRAELGQVLKKAQVVHGYTVRSAIPGFDAPGAPYR